MSVMCWWISVGFLVADVFGDMSNNLVENVNYPNCEAMLEEIPYRNVEAIQPLRIRDLWGTWYSQSCETRPGRVNVMRTYEFVAGGVANLSLHVYGDDSCRKPLFTVAAHGHVSLTRPSMVTPGATEAEYYINEISVIPHTKNSILDLVEELNTTSCSLSVMNSLKIERRTSLFHSPLSLNQVTLSDYSCVPSLVSTWNELQLLRVEVESRSYPWREDFCSKKELFLGDLHSDPAYQAKYRPTAYQVPLLHHECIRECDACKQLSISTPTSPPVLPPRALIQPPKLIEGHWASSRCEVQRYGLFLTRKISFKSSRRRWSIKQRYFYDPSCKRATYTIVASGSYKKVFSSRFENGVLDDAFDMTVRKMSITPEDKNFAAQLNRILGRVCGVSGRWRKGKSQDVTGTGGCSPIGLKVPSKEPEILRFEGGKNGQVFLYLGQTPTWSHKGKGPAPRPTAWGPKLQKCSPVPDPEDNQLRPVVGARMALVSGGTENSVLCGRFWILLFVACLWNTLQK